MQGSINVIIIQKQYNNNKMKNNKNNRCAIVIITILSVLVSCDVLHTCVGASSSSSSSPSISSVSSISSSFQNNNSNNRNTIIRIRLLDGSIEKIVIKPDSTITVQEVINSVTNSNNKNNVDNTDIEVKYDIDNTIITDVTQPILQLKYIKHGSILSLVNRSNKDLSNNSDRVSKIRQQIHTKRQSQKQKAFIPYPDLAKDYITAIQKAKTKQKTSGMSSYSTISDITSSLHTVETQTIGSIQRIYMCTKSAQQFQSNYFYLYTNTDDSQPATNHIGLLFGTIHRERVDYNAQNTKRNKKPKTSLSSTIEDDEYCTIGKVHAIYVSPISSAAATINNNNNNNYYNPTTLLELTDTIQSSIVRVSNWLGLHIIGWIYTYNDSQNSSNGKRTNDDDTVPVLPYDIYTGSKLQINTMKLYQNYNNNKDSNSIENQNQNHNNNNNPILMDGTKFCTLAMDAITGATEAFQFSDVTVQMISEDMFVLPLPVSSNDNGNDDLTPPSRNQQQKKVTNNKKKQTESESSVMSVRYTKTRYPIIVDGKETYELDTVLCIINVALLSHPNGLYVSTYKKLVYPYIKTSASSNINSNNNNNIQLTKHTKKLLLKALYKAIDTEIDTDSSNSNNQQQMLFELLCDFNILIAIDQLLVVNNSNKSNNHIEVSKYICQTVRKYVRGQKSTTKLSTTIIQLLINLLE